MISSICRDGSLLKRIASRTVKFSRMCNQARLHTERNSPVYKFGILLPRDRNHALQIDKDNDNKVWETSIGLEIDQLNECKTFRNMGKHAKIPRDHQRIRVHFVFDVKHDLRCKSRLVAGGHMTDPPKDSVLFWRCYSPISSTVYASWGTQRS